MSDSQGRVYSRIAGTGSYLPEKVLTNADLAEFVETSDEWIVARTGIRERHVAAEGETTSDLGYHAALRAMEAVEHRHLLDAGRAPGGPEVEHHCVAFETLRAPVLALHVHPVHGGHGVCPGPLVKLGVGQQGQAQQRNGCCAQ